MRSMQHVGVKVKAACLDGDGVLREIEPADARAATLDPGRFAWVHVQSLDREKAQSYLESEFGFHELAVEDSLSPYERPTFQSYPGHHFLTLSVVEPDPEEGERFIEVGIFILETAVVTVVRESCTLVERWLERWRKNPHAVASRPDWLVHALLDATVDEYFPIVDRIEDEIEDMADLVYAGKGFDISRISSYRHRLLELRKRNGPTRDILNGLLRRDLPFIGVDVAPYFQDVYDHTLRIHEGIETNREALTSVMEAHMSMVSNNLNEVMKKMTVISTMLMSAALIAGIYGMNFDRMPELHWAYGYPFSLFLMAAGSLGAFAIFRWKKWV